MAFKIFSLIRARYFNSASDTAFDVGLNGEEQARLTIDAGGKISWGAGGNSSVDTNLYREQANVLKTDDTLKVPSLFVDSIEIDTTGAASGQFLAYDGTKFIATTLSAGSSNVESLVDLLDVNVTSPSSNQVLQYDGIFWTNVTLNTFSPTISTPINGELLQYNGSAWVNTTLPTQEPMGHEDKTQSVVSFNESTRVFTIEPASSSFTVWVKGKRYVKTTAQTVTIPDTSGLYYIYFDATGALQYDTDYFDWDSEAPTAYIYWNATDDKAYFFADERHGITLDWQTHEYLHRTRGAAYAEGFAIGAYSTDGDGSSNAHMQFDLDGGTFFDEDLEVVIAHSATPTSDTWEQVLEGGAEIPVFYHDGTVWKHTTPTEYAVKQGTLPQYNLFSGGSWSTTDLTTGTYGVTWIAATNNLNYPVIGILGQKDYANLNKVAEDSWETLNIEGLPIFELRPLYKITYLVSSSFTNTPKAAIREVIDIRKTSSVASGVAATPTTDHGGLLGLSDDDHLSYVHLSNARTITAVHTFTNGLNSVGTVTAGQISIPGGSTTGAVDVIETTLESISSNQTIDSTQATSIKYIIRADDGTDAESTEILAVRRGTSISHVEYGRVATGSTDLVEYGVSQSAGNITLLATPATANTAIQVMKLILST